MIRVLVTVTVFGGVLAMAASLGGITSDTVGADDAVVASCDTDGVTTSYASAWDTVDERYEVTTVTVGGVDDACDGLTVKVTVADSGGASIGDGTLSIPTSVATSHEVTLSSAASSEAVVGVHVTIAA